MANDMSAARAARKGDKPIGRPTEPQRLDDIRVVQELYLDGKTQLEIANDTKHSPATVKKYLQDLTAVIEVHNKEKVEEKRLRTIHKLLHYQSRADKEAEKEHIVGVDKKGEPVYGRREPIKALGLAVEIQRDISKLEGLLIEKVEQNGVTEIKVTVEREKPVSI